MYKMAKHKKVAAWEWFFSIALTLSSLIGILISIINPDLFNNFNWLSIFALMLDIGGCSAATIFIMKSFKLTK